MAGRLNTETDHDTETGERERFKISQESSEGFKTQQDGVTVVQRSHSFLGSQYLRTICVYDRLLSGAETRFNGSDELRHDRNLVEHRHSAIHNDPRHDLAGERVCTKTGCAHDVYRYGRHPVACEISLGSGSDPCK